MTLKATKPLDISDVKGKVDFAIITIHDDEFRAVLKRFPKHDVAIKNRHYAISYLHTSKDTYYTLAMVSSVAEGNGQGQKVASYLIEDLDPEWLLLSGLGAGVPDYKFTLGDVVAAIRLQDFSISADLESRKLEYDNRGGPMHEAVTDILKFIPAIENELEGWNSEEFIGLIRPPVRLASKNFYGEKEWQDDLKKKMAMHFGRNVPVRSPKFTTLSVASSDQLMKNTATLQTWLESARKIGVVEMELAGVYLAAQRNPPYPVLAIRGISDIVGFKCDPAWTEYACHSAASFAHALLKTEFKPPKDSDFAKQRLREITFPDGVDIIFPPVKGPFRVHGHPSEKSWVKSKLASHMQKCGLSFSFEQNAELRQIRNLSDNSLPTLLIIGDSYSPEEVKEFLEEIGTGKQLLELRRHVFILLTTSRELPFPIVELYHCRGKPPNNLLDGLQHIYNRSMTEMPILTTDDLFIQAIVEEFEMGKQEYHSQFLETQESGNIVAEMYLSAQIESFRNVCAQVEIIFMEMPHANFRNINYVSKFMEPFFHVRDEVTEIKETIDLGLCIVPNHSLGASCRTNIEFILENINQNILPGAGANGKKSQVSPGLVQDVANLLTASEGLLKDLHEVLSLISKLYSKR